MHNLWLTVNNYGLNIADLSVVAGFLRLGREQKSKNGICCRPIIISAKEVIFSLCLFICLFVHLFISLLAGLCKNYSTDLRKIRWKGGTLATDERSRL